MADRLETTMMETFLRRSKMVRKPLTMDDALYALIVHDQDADPPWQMIELTCAWCGKVAYWTSQYEKLIKGASLQKMFVQTFLHKVGIPMEHSAEWRAKQAGWGLGKVPVCPTCARLTTVYCTQCRMSVPTKHAVRATSDGQPTLFCSYRCRGIWADENRETGTTNTVLSAEDAKKLLGGV